MLGRVQGPLVIVFTAVIGINLLCLVVAIPSVILVFLILHLAATLLSHASQGCVVLNLSSMFSDVTYFGGSPIRAATLASFLCLRGSVNVATWWSVMYSNDVALFSGSGLPLS